MLYEGKPERNVARYVKGRITLLIMLINILIIISLCRYVFQAVHMLFEGNPERKWRPDEKRVSKMVFIGRELDKEAFEQAFKNCLVKAPAARR